MTTGQVAWRGLVLGVQPRIDLMRSFDQRSHSYLGYVLLIDGSVGDAPRGSRFASAPRRRRNTAYVPVTAFQGSRTR